MILSEIKGILRSVLTNAQDGRCYLCGREIKPEFYAGPEACTFEHVHPRDLVRREVDKVWRIGNHLVAHSCCNADKGNRPATGCEVLMLYTVNRRLRYPEDRTRHWDRAQGDCSHVLAQNSCSK